MVYVCHIDFAYFLVFRNNENQLIRDAYDEVIESIKKTCICFYSRRNLSAPGAATGGSWDSCMTFDVNWTDVLETMQPPPEGTPMIPCQHGWDFEFSDIPYETVVTEVSSKSF